MGLYKFQEVSDVPAFRRDRNQTKNNISPDFSYFVEEVLNIMYTDFRPKII